MLPGTTSSPTEAPSVAAARNSGTIGPSDSRSPWRGGGGRQVFERETHALSVAESVGDQDLIRDQQARTERARRRVEADDRLLDEPRTTRGGASSSLDPYGYLGPRSRARRDRALLARAEATGDEDLIRDWRDRSSRSEAAVKRLEHDPDQAKLDLLMSSRIGADGKLYPLVSRLLAAGGSLKTAEGAEAVAAQMQTLGMRGVTASALQGFATGAMPGLLAGGAMALGAGAVYGVAEAGSARMRAANQAFYQMGGTSGNVGAAMALGGDDAAAKAMAFGDRLRQGSYGAAFFRSQGIYDRGAYQTNKSGNYVRALDSLRGVSDVQERIRIARDTGLTDDLWTTDLSPSTYRALRGSRGGAGTANERRAEAEYRAQKEEVGGYWNSFVKTAGGAAMQVVQDTVAVGQVLTGIVGIRNDISQRGVKTLSRHWNPWDDGGPNSFSGRDDTPEGRKRAKNGGRPRWQNVDPTLGDGPNTVNGSTAGAIPIGWRGQALNADLDRLNSMIGAF